MNIREIALISAALLGAFIVLMFALRRSSKGSTRWPFYPKRLMTRAEQTLYFRIVKALPDHVVLAKVHLESFLGVKNGHRAGAWNRRIDNLTTDFLVCTHDARVVVAIDMEGETPETPRRVAENKRKSQALAAAGIKHVCWHVRSMPTDTAIRSMLIRRVRHVGPLREHEPARTPKTPVPGPGKASQVPLSHRPATTAS